MRAVNHRLRLATTNRTLLNAYHRMLNRLRQLSRTLLTFRKIRTNAIGLTAIRDNGYLLMSRFGPFLRQCPNLRISLRINDRTRLRSHLHHGRSSFCLLDRSPPLPGLSHIPCTRTPLQIITSPRRPLTRRPSLALTSLTATG